MDIDAIEQFLGGLRFREAAWLFLPAFALHVLEEAPQFTAWVNRHASPRFTRADFLRNYGLGMALGLLLCTAVALYPRPSTVLAFLALGVWQAGFNTLFHIATTAAYGVYSPGLITALTLYLALCCYLSRLAFQEGLVTNASGLIALLLGGALHASVVAVQVYFFKPFGRPQTAVRNNNPRIPAPTP
jgi:hypothetical protein